MKNHPQQKLSEHIPCGYSVTRVCIFYCKENKSDIYIFDDCMKKYCKFVGEHSIKIIIFKKSKMILLTYKKHESYLNEVSSINGKNYLKLKTIVTLEKNIKVLRIEYTI